MTTGAGEDKVLTTDASGVASWQTAAVGGTPGGSTGYVQFASSTSFAGDSNLFWDNINERLGIGTTEPQTQLDVVGAIKIGTQATCNSNTTGAIRYNSAEEKFEGCNGQTWNLIASIHTWVCGESITFTYKGYSVTYGTVKNPTTSECWMDRNLGASQVATVYNDSEAYGDLFQWGRLDDGHQTRTSGTTTDLSSTDIPGHSNFIYGMVSPYDWRSPQNDNLWQGEGDIYNPCPSGWRIPTELEWEAERLSWTEGSNYIGAFASPLKLPAGGYRTYFQAILQNMGSIGYYWTSTVDNIHAHYLVFSSGIAVVSWYNRAYGLSVRCVQD